MRRPNRFQEQFGAPADHVVSKFQDRLDEWTQRFIKHSPFVVVSTCRPEGQCTCSPRGGRPGFVRIVDDAWLLLPDYRGNRLFESLVNLDANPQIALLFLIPGVHETVRVTGTASVVGREELLRIAGESSDIEEAVQGVMIRVARAYYHCGRALRLADLWNGTAIQAMSANPPVPRRPSKPKGA